MSACYNLKWSEWMKSWPIRFQWVTHTHVVTFRILCVLERKNERKEELYNTMVTRCWIIVENSVCFVYYFIHVFQAHLKTFGVFANVGVLNIESKNNNRSCCAWLLAQPALLWSSASRDDMTLVNPQYNIIMSLYKCQSVAVGAAILWCRI